MLVALPGIGPWTAEYVAMRALRDPDAFMPTDLGILRAARGLGLPEDRGQLAQLTEGWRPWRSYASFIRSSKPNDILTKNFGHSFSLVVESNASNLVS